MSGREIATEKQLAISGIGVFLPREIRYRRAARYLRRQRVEVVGYARFPGYTFVAMDAAASQWPRVRALPFVLGVLGIGGRPVALAPGEVERMRADDGKIVPHVSSVPTHRAIVPGQTVRIAAGPFRDWVVKVERISRRGAHATLNFLCAQHELELPLEWLEAS